MRLTRRAVLTGSLLLVAGAPSVRAGGGLCAGVDLDAFAHRLFLRECGGRKQNLVWWSPREAFPSLGIGHFIWPPAGVVAPYEATFAHMVRWVGQQSEAAPRWLQAPHAPWPDRPRFVAEGDSPRILAAREWLWRTRRQQATWVVRRFRRRWARVLKEQPDAARLNRRLQHLAQAPGGCWAVLDYVNFKGMGDNPKERYAGIGWGLLQVLRAMEGDTLADFIAAAERVLRRRIDHAPRDETPWWPGWQRRLQSWLEAS